MQTQTILVLPGQCPQLSDGLDDGKESRLRLLLLLVIREHLYFPLFYGSRPIGGISAYCELSRDNIPAPTPAGEMKVGVVAFAWLNNRTSQINYYLLLNLGAHATE
jgi:hypothetical protein